MRARLVGALFLTAAASLAVAALALLPPLQARLRTDAARTLQLHAEAAREGFERPSCARSSGWCASWHGRPVRGSCW